MYKNTANTITHERMVGAIGSNNDNRYTVPNEVPIINTTAAIA